MPLCVEVGGCIFVSWLAAPWLLWCLLQERALFLRPSVFAPQACLPFPATEDGLDQASCLLPVIISLCLQDSRDGWAGSPGHRAGCSGR